jgi:hypothetical protein
MRFNKKYWPYLILSFLLISQIIVVAFRIDIWPFSCYPMFSQLHSANEIGAYRIEVITHDHRTLTVFLYGGKDRWQAYQTLIEKNNILALNMQMKRDLDNYISSNPEVKLTQMAEARLVSVGLSDSAAHGKSETQKILHSFRL